MVDNRDTRDTAALKEVRELARELRKAPSPREAYAISTRLNEASKRLDSKGIGQERKGMLC